MNCNLFFRTLLLLSCFASSSAFAGGACTQIFEAEINTTPYSVITTSTQGKGPGVFKIDLVDQEGKSIISKESQVFSESDRVFTLDATPKEDPTLKQIVVASWPVAFVLRENKNAPGEYFVASAEALRFFNDFRTLWDVGAEWVFRLSENRAFFAYWSPTGRKGKVQIVSRLFGVPHMTRAAVVKASELTEPVTIGNDGTLFLGGKPLQFENY